MKGFFARGFAASFGVVVVLGLSCYSSYTGIYWVKSAKYSESTEFDDLALQVSRELGLLGFTREPPSAPHFALFWKEGAGEGVAGDPLAGSRARMTVAIDLSDLTITVRDLSNTGETEFNQRVKRVIEETLESRYGVSDLVFKRQWDIF